MDGFCQIHLFILNKFKLKKNLGGSFFKGLIRLISKNSCVWFWCIILSCWLDVLIVLYRITCVEALIAP